MALLLGPVLSFRGCENGVWNLTAIVVAKDAAPVVKGEAGVAQPDILWARARGTVYRYRLAFAMGADARAAIYAVDDVQYEVAVPAIGQAPTMAYISCNGFSSTALMNQVEDKFRMWRALAKKHGLPPDPKAPKDDATLAGMTKASPYHLLIQGGDQVYADEMQDRVPFIQTWYQKNWKDANAYKPTEAMQEKLDDFYFDLYVERWSSPDMSRMLARVPGIAMWDDHDLIDGWGSYPPERQNCGVFQSIWKSASKAFAVFQQHLMPGERRPGAISKADADWWQKPLIPAGAQEKREGAFSFAYVVGGIAILALDLRSQRTYETQVVGETHSKEIYAWIEKDMGQVDHLLVMSSIPVVYPDFSTIEKALGIFPGYQDLEDDLRDHWNSPPHKEERRRLAHRLLDVSEKKGIRTTILSGDVHVAALGTIKSTRNQATGTETVINQLISSGIVHPGPGGLVLFALQNLFDDEDTIDREVIARMTPFVENKAKFIGARNFLSIEPDPPGVQPKPRIWCNFIAEKEKFQFTKVIHPI